MLVYLTDLLKKAKHGFFLSLELYEPLIFSGTVKSLRELLISQLFDLTEVC